MMIKIIETLKNLESKYVPLILKYADDKVPNIKIIVLKWILKVSDELRFKSEFQLYATKCSTDSDEDVKYFAKQ